MKWPYQVGTKVKISKEGHSLYGVAENNPKNMVGKVIDIIYVQWREGNILEVLWDNGKTNTYREGTLTPVQINLENK